MSGEASSTSDFNESHWNKFWRKCRDAPFVPAGVGGLLGAVAYGIYGYRNRGNMSASVYIMHFRVIAQGMVVGAITIGVGMNITIKLWERYVKALPPLPAANEKK